MFYFRLSVENNKIFRKFKSYIMKRIVLMMFFNLFFTTNLVAQENKTGKNQSESKSEELIIKIDKLVSLSKEQYTILKKHFQNKMDFFADTELSDARKEIVLLAYKREFENCLTARQIQLLNENKKMSDTIFSSY
jgi:hypothetical protein